jgi:hypothetical protein
VLHRTAHAKAKGPKKRKRALRQPPMFAVSIDLGMCMGSTEISNTCSNNNNNSNNSNNNNTQHISGLAGNCPHTDAMDILTSFGIWVKHYPSLGGGSWWFLLPEHSVAVEIGNGTGISWVGAEVLAHCTIVPG